MDLVGRTLGQFEIIEQLGKGGMATVYKAYQASLQRHVALKVLSPALAENADLVRRFLREAQSAAALHHPNVIVIHDVGSAQDLHFIVTEYLEGLTLAQRLEAADEQGVALSLDRVLHIVRQVATALDYAHARGYVHRDIKPSNIMVDPARGDQVTLMDFGLVQVMGASRLTRTGLIMGTPDYMSPEQAKGEAIDGRTDIYSLGVTTYHMLTSRVPFPKPTPHAILMAHIMEEPPAMSSPIGDIPPGVEAVVFKSMAKDPNDRYEWASDLANDLELQLSASELGDALSLAAPAEGSASRRSTTLEAAMPVTPPLGTASPQTPPGAPAYLPPPSHTANALAETAHTTAPPTRPRWVWPVVGISALAFVAVVVILGILVTPSILRSFPSNARQTATAQALAARLQTFTPAPSIERFDVLPAEIVEGESVTIEWHVSGVASVSIRPGVVENGPPSGIATHQPLQTTTYELILANGASRTTEVIVRSAPGLPTSSPPPTATHRVPMSTPPPTATPLPPTFTLAPTATPRVPTSTPPPTATPASTLPPTEAPSATLLPPTTTPTPTTTPEPSATAPPAPSSGVLISFERWGTWTRGRQPYGELTQTTDQVHSGSYAAKLSYDFPETGEDFVVYRQATAIGGTPNTISVWVYGDGSGHLISVWIQDAKTQVWSVHLGRIGTAGWQQLTGRIDAKRAWPSGHVFGPQDEVIDFPIGFYGLVLDRPAAGPTKGTIYLDDVSIDQVEAPMPGETPGVGAPVSGTEGRIVLTVQSEERYSLYATDPNWDRMARLGDTDWEHSTCTESNVATTLGGLTIPLRQPDRCSVAGTVDSCTSPNGQFKVNTNRKGNGYQVTLWRTTDNKMLEAVYAGPLNIHPGINWSPDSSHFLFTVRHSVYRADVGQAGYRVIIPFKHDTWPLQYTPDGRHVYYLKPVSGAISDVFLAQPDGSNERNLTRSSTAIKLCPRWRR
jgi:serine/threonine-protein kinase